MLAGALRHADDAGHRGEARPGVVQRMSAGAGVRHAEHAGRPARTTCRCGCGRPRRAARRRTTPWPSAPGLAELSPLRQPAATLHAGRLPAGGSAALPAARTWHVLVVAGTVELLVGPRWAAPDRTPGRRSGPLGRRTGAGPRGRRAARRGRPGRAAQTAAGADVIAWGMRAGLSVG